MIKFRLSFTIASFTIIFSSCKDDTAFQKDLDFLKKHDSVIVLSRGDAELIVSPKYQAKVFTSTTGDGLSHGWINYDVFNAPPDPHMNAYGGENRIWLGPEGGPFSLFFPKGFVMDFANWKIPAAFDTEPWKLVFATDTNALMQKDMKLANYSGTELFASVEREIIALDKPSIERLIGAGYSDEIRAVGYMTKNKLTNTGSLAWNDSTGAPCIWILDMFMPSAKSTVIIPFQGDSAGVINTSYFGKIPASRLKFLDGVLLFKADGKKRSKIGIPPGAASSIAGSYDPNKQTLTLTVFDIHPAAPYLNMEWTTEKPAFSGDAVNAYNDGPLEDGRLLGPFYELESVSPAAFLAPGQSIFHYHSVFHLTGSEDLLDAVCKKTLGISLQEVKKAMEE